MNFKKILINFRKKVYSGIIPFGYKGKEEIHKYMQYKVSITACVGWITNQRKDKNGCLLKTTSQNH